MSRFSAYTVLLSALLGCALVSPSTGEIKAIEQHTRYMRSALTSMQAATAAPAKKGDTIPNLEAAGTSRKAAGARLFDSMVVVTGIGQLSCQPAEIQDHVTCSYTVKLLRFGPSFQDGGQGVEFKRPQETAEAKQKRRLHEKCGKMDHGSTLKGTTSLKVSKTVSSSKVRFTHSVQPWNVGLRANWKLPSNGWCGSRAAHRECFVPVDQVPSRN